MSLLIHRVLSMGNLSWNIAMRPFNSFLILLNLLIDLSPEQLVTIKLKIRLLVF